MRTEAAVSQNKAALGDLRNAKPERFWAQTTLLCCIICPLAGLFAAPPRSAVTKSSTQIRSCEPQDKLELWSMDPP